MVPKLGVASIALAWTTLVPATAGAQERRLSAEDQQRLIAGEVVTHHLEFERPSGDYVGGIAYMIIAAPVGAVMGTLMDIPAYQKFMPMTLDARVEAVEGGDVWVHLEHGNSLGEAGYTVRARRDGARTLRFWMDHSRDHDIDDLWGYWRVQPLEGGQTLLTYGAAVDVGGILELLEDRIRNYALKTPKNLRDYVEDKVRKLDRPLQKTALAREALSDIRIDSDTALLGRGRFRTP